MDLLKDNYMTTSGSGPSWKIDIQPPKKQVKSFYEEALYAAEYIYANKQGKLYLLYSGGMDSEYVFNLYLSAGMDVTPVIIRLNPGYNAHDVKYAFDFCESKGITPLVFDIDFDDFVKSGRCLDIANAIECPSYHVSATMHVASQLDGTVILGNDPPYLKWKGNYDNPSWHLEELQIIHSILKYFKQNKVYGTPYFLSYTAEMMLSWLLEPTIADLANGLTPQYKDMNECKVFAFNNNPKFTMENRIKYHGYENLPDTEIYQHELLKPLHIYTGELFEPRNGYHFEDYHQIVKKLSIHQTNLS